MFSFLLNFLFYLISFMLFTLLDKQQINPIEDWNPRLKCMLKLSFAGFQLFGNDLFPVWTDN